MCSTGWFKCELMRSEESIICDRVFEGSAILCLVSENIVAESGIMDGFSIRAISCVLFVRVRVRFMIC